MPYIFCEYCGEGAYSNVKSCPHCGRVARLARPRRLVWLIPVVDGSSHGAEEVESEVRETLYGRRSLTVQLRREQMSANTRETN
jgi:ribosomal protein L37E